MELSHLDRPTFSPKSTLTIAPGAVLEFDSDRGLRVQGTIIAKGTEDEPIIFRAALGKTWSGIMFENKSEFLSCAKQGQL